MLHLGSLGSHRRAIFLKCEGRFRKGAVVARTYIWTSLEGTQALSPTYMVQGSAAQSYAQEAVPGLAEEPLHLLPEDAASLLLSMRKPSQTLASSPSDFHLALAACLLPAANQQGAVSPELAHDLMDLTSRSVVISSLLHSCDWPQKPSCLIKKWSQTFLSFISKGE